MFGKIVLGACVVSYVFASVTRGYLAGVAANKGYELSDDGDFSVIKITVTKADEAKSDATPAAQAA